MKLNLKLNPKLQAILIIAVIAAVIIGVAVAASSLTQTINYTKSQVSITWDEQSPVSYVAVDSITKLYTITNDGNTAAVVTASCLASGATSSWDHTTLTIAAGGSGLFTLTLTVTADGSATVSFNAVKA